MYLEGYEEILDAMTLEERSWFNGFAFALLHAQAANDVEGGMQTLVTHYPSDRYDPIAKRWVDIDDFEKKLSATVSELDGDSPIISMRFYTEERKVFDQSEDDTTYTVHLVEIGSSEGFFGSPEWDE